MPGGRHQATAWYERNRVGYVFSLAGNQVLSARAVELAEEIRRFGEIRYGAKGWEVERKVVARIREITRAAGATVTRVPKPGPSRAHQ